MERLLLYAPIGFVTGFATVAFYFEVESLPAAIGAGLFGALMGAWAPDLMER